MSPASFVWSIPGVLLLPLALAKPLRRDAVQRRLRQHGRWLVPVAWLLGVSMVVGPLAMSRPTDVPALRLLEFTLCLYGPVFIALVALSVRDARRGALDLPIRISSPDVPRWVRAVSALFSLLLVVTIVAQALSGEWRGPLYSVGGAALFGYVALTGRAGFLSRPV